MTESYDWADNARGCYNVAIRTLRLNLVASGEAEPLPDDPEELALAPRTQAKLHNPRDHDQEGPRRRGAETEAEASAA